MSHAVLRGLAAAVLVANRLNGSTVTAAPAAAPLTGPAAAWAPGTGPAADAADGQLYATAIE
ncbi:hypothetical protein BVC93_24410 [Mycobacterium sp. MS1601]|nr:hypothetical protein BVC93_24410 [Mycobacterium sp. MS1601]